ncbi:hypothetical protein [Mucilaginibacter aquatilis]|uniref:Uncharacterized protein n=1 Tax=Mucilaginibacter aquatilis TaxID=1517760 RepID=A0A6I4I576_9SPHI|nr:hypothetical protein [Mucilaginibacter aquatilis]MVN89957.1 hypothetical protein [Mucilaginibacter aquatilis]
MTLQERIKEKITGQLKDNINEQNADTLSQLLTADVKYIATAFAEYGSKHPELEVHELFDEWFKNHFTDPQIKNFE